MPPKRSQAAPVPTPTEYTREIAETRLAALGLATLFKAAPWTVEVVHLAGAAYLLWLGVQQWLFGSLLIGFALRLTFVQQA